MEILPNKTLKVGNKLTPIQEQQLLDILKIQNYVSLLGIIVTWDAFIFIFVNIIQISMRMNIALKNIIKIKLQNILCAHFIYPISYGEWVPHFLLFLRKDGSEEFVWTMENVIRPLKRVIFPCHLLTKS